MLLFQFVTSIPCSIQEELKFWVFKLNDSLLLCLHRLCLIKHTTNVAYCLKDAYTQVHKIRPGSFKDKDLVTANIEY